jgi:hypothetical protein
MNHLPELRWLAGSIVALSAMSTAAAPPIFNTQNRVYDNWAGAGVCTNLEHGDICRDISAWENYDVKGDYQYTEVVLNVSVWEDDPETQTGRSGWHYIRCPFDKSVMSTNPNGVTLEATLDPAAPGCITDGYMETWDPDNGYQSFPWPFSGPRDVAGEWLEPANYMHALMNRNETYHDGWSETTTSTVEHCIQEWGDMMKAGGFSVRNRYFPFSGLEGPVSSSYYITSCNNRNGQR